MFFLTVCQGISAWRSVGNRRTNCFNFPIKLFEKQKLVLALNPENSIGVINTTTLYVKIGIPIQCITNIIATVIPKLLKARSRQYVDLPYHNFHTLSPISFLCCFKVNLASMNATTIKIKIAIVQNLIMIVLFCNVISVTVFSSMFV